MALTKEDMEQLKKELQTDYPLIPTKDITDEARLIAVRWMECDDKNWIGNKQKLASDIMNYARRSSSLRQQELENKIIELDRMADESHAAFVISEQKNVTLESLITLKESERQQWADMCVKKQEEIERLNKHIDKLSEYSEAMEKQIQQLKKLVL